MVIKVVVRIIVLFLLLKSHIVALWPSPQGAKRSPKKHVMTNVLVVQYHVVKLHQIKSKKLKIK